MNFEKLELYGFKSFADKVEIKFNDGITGIVGPNGCGKSNVADAIRWVLGEQSAKTLRGSSMQDVIFSGTQARKSLSYCEVSLYFDNSTRMFSLDYNEVIITRKLFRSGESEYYINKQPSRLRDIVDLLHECGIGKEGYSIIGQGKVEEIMSAKPEDRRAIFEEATGIAKFKARKNETQRKLERTKENLFVFSNVLSELEAQLAPLEKQAEKTRQFRDLSEQLKHHEINTYISKYDNVAVEKEKIDNRIRGIQEEGVLRQGEYESAQKRYETIFDQINGADAKLNDLHEKLLVKTVDIEKQAGEAKLYGEKISFLRSQIDRLQTEIEQNDATADGHRAQIEENDRLKAEKRKQIKSIVKRSEEIREALAKVLTELSAYEGLAEQSRKKMIESIESLSDINLNKGSLGAEKQALEGRKREIEQELTVLNEKRNCVYGEKEALDQSLGDSDRKVSDLKNQILEQEDIVRNINETVADIDNKLYNLNSNVTMLAAKENFIIGIKESYEGYLPAVKRLLVSAKEDKRIGSRIKGVVASVIRTEARYDVAIETALGASQQNVITANTDDAKFLIEYLKQTHAGRVTFLPVTSMKPRFENDSVKAALREPGALGLANRLVSYDPYFENVISNLLGNTLIVDQIHNATNIANKYRFAFKIVTLEGDVFNPQGSMTGGSRRQDAPNLLAGDRQLDEIREKLSAKRKEMDGVKKEKAAAEEKRDAAMNDLTMLNEMYQSQRQEQLLIREKLNVSEASLIDLGKEIESRMDDSELLTRKIAFLEQEIQKILSGSEKLVEEKESANQDAFKHQSEYDLLRKRQNELTEESTDLQIKLTAVNADLSALESDSEWLQSEIERFSGIKEDYLKNISDTEVIIGQLKRSAEQVALSKEEQDYVDNLRNQISNIESEKSALREEMNRTDELRAQLSARLNELAEKKHAEEIALTKIDSDIEYMQQRIWEEYQESYETAVKWRQEGYDSAEGEQEIARLKRRINALGSINPNAIEDCKVLKDRYDEMVVQKEDLEKGEADLQQAIDTLKAEMLKTFNEGFNTINENFKKIFKELFGGGRAMLELDYTDVEDPLEAGVDIIAEPPGKKLQKISLLSGGERALTAIAILFSILRLRPMPFCVLDEIEAALDEANVDRFARYLKKFSQDTQFIVITHRKPTMELADSLFGVTMEEKGVSKIVSVKLSDIIDEEAV